jgi:hypothetical protein
MSGWFTRRRGLWFAGGLIAATVCFGLTTSAAAGPERRQAIDLSISGIEVTQATQTPTNSVLLVSRRGTAVRATLAVTGATAPVAGITGRLHVFVGSTEVTPVAGVAPINAPFTAPLAPQRNNENDTLNFELTAPTSITASSAVQFRVDITPIPGEANVTNNSLTTPNLTVADRQVPLLFFTSINYTPSGLGLPAASFIQPGTGDAFVRGILPVDESNSTLYRQGLFPTLGYSEDANGDGILDALGSDGNNLLTLLESCRQLIVNNGFGPSDRVFLYGWLAGNPIDGNGLASVGGRVAFGNTDPIRGQRSYAHELTHNFGLSHNSRALDQVGWDVGARLPNNPSGNNTTGRVKPVTVPPTFFDIQFPGLLTNQAWVDTITYNFLLSSSTLASAPDIKKFRPRVAVIRGIFNPEGSRLIRLLPVFRAPWPSQPTATGREGRYRIQIVDTAGARLQSVFTPLIADDPSQERERFGAFEVMIPVSAAREIASLRVLGPSGQALATVKRSRPPRIAVVTPGPGARVRGRARISWRAQDGDTRPARLLYQVAYSPDAGRTWVPLAVDVPGTKTAVGVDIRRVRKSAGRGIIRVFVGDGLNTVYADTRRLTVTPR